MQFCCISNGGKKKLLNARTVGTETISSDYEIIKNKLSGDYHSSTVLPNHFYLLKNEVHFVLPAYPNLCQQQL